MKIPKGWHEVTIRKYYEYHTIITKFKDIDPLDLEIKIVSCLTGTTENDLLNLTTSQLTSISKKLGWLKELPSEKNIPVKIKIKGDIYKASILFSDMKAVQFRHFSDICKGIKPEDYVFQMHNLIGSMMSKKKNGVFIQNGEVYLNKYEYDGYESVADMLLDNMSMDQAYPYYVFFCKVMENSYHPIQDSLIKNMKKMSKELRKLMKRSKKDFTKIGVGCVSGILLAITTLLNGNT